MPDDFAPTPGDPDEVTTLRLRVHNDGVRMEALREENRRLAELVQAQHEALEGLWSAIQSATREDMESPWPQPLSERMETAYDVLHRWPKTGGG